MVCSPELGNSFFNFMKKCTQCGIAKEENEFHKQKKGKNGLMASCIYCHRLLCAKNRKYNIKKTKERNQKYYEENKIYILKRCADYRILHKEIYDNTQKLYYEKNKNKRSEYYKKYKILNIETIKKKQQERNKKNRSKKNENVKSRKAKDKIFSLRLKLSDRIRKSFKGKNLNKNLSSHAILGCSILVAKKHIESMFKEGMNWDNNTVFGWHIDHIIPLSSAKIEEELMRLCHYTNLQPLWWHENLSKGGKIPCLN